MADEKPTMIRLLQDRPERGLEVGQLYSHDGEIYGPEGKEYALITDADGNEYSVSFDHCEVVEVVSTADLHVITERADGPDLDDLVRLIRYLRGHRVQHSLRDAHTWEDDDLFDPARLTVAFGKAAITDGAPLPDLYGLVAYFVGPDGTVYDCNGEAL